MDFIDAYKTLVERSVERNTKEIPTILSCIDFENKNCLEIGAGPLARLSIKLSGFVNHITCLENNENTVNSIEYLVKQHNLEKRISAQFYQPQTPYKLPFKTNQFDVVYGAWLPHKLATNTEFLEEISRVTSKNILIVMPGTKGDEPKLVSLVRPGELERRTEYRSQITKYLESKGFEVKTKDEVLLLDFASNEEIRDVFSCMAFKNELTKVEQKKVYAFLDKRTHNFKDGFYCIVGTKSN